MRTGLRIRRLTDELDTCETRIEEIKAELAGLLLGAQAPPAQTIEAATIPAAQGVRPQRSTPASRRASTNGAVSSGTKGYKTLKAIAKLGGEAQVADISARLTWLPKTPKVRKARVRSYIRYLSLPDNKYLEPTGTRGLWRITEKGWAAIGGRPG